jgi:hypothetical protein
MCFSVHFTDQLPDFWTILYIKYVNHSIYCTYRCIGRTDV